MHAVASFEELVEEGLLAPIEGWDFSWLDRRATEERPPWGYSGVAAQRAQNAASLLDLQTGGGELLSALPALPPSTVATEGWRPNATRAAARLLERHVPVVQCDDRELPFCDRSFELVLSRHPVATWWNEVARVLTPGGRYLSQQVGPASMAELTEFLMGPQRATSSRRPENAARAAEAAGLHVEDLQSARLRATFSDVGAIVYFLRLVIWIVPDFTVAKYHDRLMALHERIEADGPFVAHATRFLIEATKHQRRGVS
jgi:SAM-dependent methyltransferase